MSQIQKLLLIAHPDLHDTPALHRATALAEACGASLHVLAYVEPFATFNLLARHVQSDTRESLLSAQRERWDKDCHLQRGRGAGIEMTSSVSWTTDLRTDLLQAIRELQPDVVIKDIQHESALKRSFVTPLDWHLLRECSQSLHLVHDAYHPLPRRIVAAVDPADPRTLISGVNEQIISAANGLALQCSAELHLLYIYDCMPAYMANRGEGTVAWVDLVEEVRASLHQSFVNLADQHGVPQERRHFLMGTPLRGISRFAQESKMDVVVMGRVHRTGVDRLIGSTTEHVLDQIPSSVLAVRSES
ncbi:universal stress protein [Pseudomonas nitroreducens]|uniref:universal stress protein n=1 Tax=Pseudomonas nitroreducens TaxID=46680 RepID=UPI003D2B81E1